MQVRKCEPGGGFIFSFVLHGYKQLQVEASSLFIIVAEVKYSGTIALVITTLGALFLGT